MNTNSVIIRGSIINQKIINKWNIEFNDTNDNFEWFVIACYNL